MRIGIDVEHPLWRWDWSSLHLVGGIAGSVLFGRVDRDIRTRNFSTFTGTVFFDQTFSDDRSRVSYGAEGNLGLALALPNLGPVSGVITAGYRVEAFFGLINTQGISGVAGGANAPFTGVFGKRDGYAIVHGPFVRFTLNF